MNAPDSQQLRSRARYAYLDFQTSTRPSENHTPLKTEYIQPAAQSTRIVYLDAMRAILMMLGLVLHSAQVFNPARTWLVADPATSPIAGMVVDTIHTFRMPAFFAVSGFFCLLTLKKYGHLWFLRVRLQRIIIPLIATALSLNLLQAIILANTGRAEITLYSYFLDGDWVSHLWFLNYLVVYFIVACSLHFLFEKTRSGDIHFTLLSDRALLWTFLFTAPLYTLGFKALGLAGFPLYWDLAGVLQKYGLIMYAQYFLFGIWLQSRPSLMKQVTEFPLTAAGCVVVAAITLRYQLTDDGGFAFIVVDEYLRMLHTWFALVLCFSLFRRLFNQSSRFISRLSDASYTVYLSHHFLVVIFAIALLDWSIHPLAKFGLMISFIFVITYGLHRMVIRRTPVLKLLFNGK